jgi:hypothetical protein
MVVQSRRMLVVTCLSGSILCVPCWLRGTCALVFIAVELTGPYTCPATFMLSEQELQAAVASRVGTGAYAVCRSPPGHAQDVRVPQVHHKAGHVSMLSCGS